MAAKKNRLTDTAKLLIHEFRNCVHQIKMELDLAELAPRKNLIMPIS